MANGVKTIVLALSLLALLSACEQNPSKSNTQKKVDLQQVYNLAAGAYTDQKWAEAEKQYLILSRESPSEVEPWFKLGNIYARTQRSELAIKFYREALVRDSAHIKSWHNMAVLQLREAGKSFSELEILVDKDDALFDKSVNIQRSIDELVN